MNQTMDQKQDKVPEKESTQIKTRSKFFPWDSMQRCAVQGSRNRDSSDFRTVHRIMKVLASGRIYSRCIFLSFSLPISNFLSLIPIAREVFCVISIAMLCSLGCQHAIKCKSVTDRRKCWFWSGRSPYGVKISKVREWS